MVPEFEIRTAFYPISYTATAAGEWSIILVSVDRHGRAWMSSHESGETRPIVSDAGADETPSGLEHVRASLMRTAEFDSPWAQCSIPQMVEACRDDRNDLLVAQYFWVDGEADLVMVTFRSDGKDKMTKTTQRFDFDTLGAKHLQAINRAETDHNSRRCLRSYDKMYVGTEGDSQMVCPQRSFHDLSALRLDESLLKPVSVRVGGTGELAF